MRGPGVPCVADRHAPASQDSLAGGCRATAIGTSGARTGMVRISDPVHQTHLNLREFADMAAWLSVLADTAQKLEDLLVDVPPEERQLPDFSTPWPWES